MREKNPDMVAGEKKKFVMKPPQVMRVGTKKTSFSNFSEICKMYVDKSFQVYGLMCYHIRPTKPIPEAVHIEKRMQRFFLFTQNGITFNF